MYLSPAIIPLPTAADHSQGGHSVLCVGYDYAKQWFIIRNSWGTGYQDGTPVGDGGYFYIPYAYVTESNLAADFWVINAVKD